MKGIISGSLNQEAFITPIPHPLAPPTPILEASEWRRELEGEAPALYNAKQYYFSPGAQRRPRAYGVLL